MSSDFLLGQGDPNRKPIGMVIGGSVTRGLDIRLQSNQDDEEVQVGNLVTVQSRQGRFFGTPEQSKSPLRVDFTGRYRTTGRCYKFNFRYA